jgi:pimeloyl-ACP methyl ester carboxylesterase
MKVSVIGPNTDSDALITVFLHGFPALHSKQNREIAEVAAKNLERETHLLFYTGLGFAPGEFRFQKCLSDVATYFAELIEKRPKVKIDIVGHSWGGYLALQMATRFAPQIRRMVLMSPLLMFSAIDLGVEILDDYARNNPMLTLGDPEELAVDFTEIGSSMPAAELIGAVSEAIEILFLQARNDDITPTRFALNMIDDFKRRPLLEIVDTDHSFIVDRPRLSQRIAAFLK